MLKTKQTTVVGTNGHKEKVPICKPGDCVALVYPNNDPLSYLTAFYGCLLAGIVPISVEVPTSKRVSPVLRTNNHHSPLIRTPDFNNLDSCLVPAAFVLL